MGSIVNIASSNFCKAHGLLEILKNSLFTTRINFPDFFSTVSFKKSNLEMPLILWLESQRNQECFVLRNRNWPLSIPRHHEKNIKNNFICFLSPSAGEGHTYSYDETSKNQKNPNRLPLDLRKNSSKKWYKGHITRLDWIKVWEFLPDAFKKRVTLQIEYYLMLILS